MAGVCGSVCLCERFLCIILVISNLWLCESRSLLVDFYVTMNEAFVEKYKEK